jgi:hypothetical protein
MLMMRQPRNLGDSPKRFMHGLRLSPQNNVYVCCDHCYNRIVAVVPLDVVANVVSKALVLSEALA